ncbi:MAG: hypothetical protein ACI4S0_10195 [Dorea sp.]
MASRRKRKKRNYLMRRYKRMIRIQQKRKKNRSMNSGNRYKDVFYSNRVYDFLSERKFGRIRKSLINQLKKTVRIEIPPLFSISENPNETIEIIKRLFYYGAQRNITEIIIDHSQCIKLEIAASTIMDVVVNSIRQWRHKNRLPIDFSGMIPDIKRVKDVFIASGLAAHMEVEFLRNVSADMNRIRRFKLMSGLQNSSNADEVATKLVEYIKQCLETQGFTLTNSGISSLGMIFGEVLDNSRIHGGKDAIWYALGHYQIYDDLDGSGEAQLVIFNFGHTIFEQICNPGVSGKEVIQKLNYLDEKHKHNYSRKWDKEMLATLLSLQEGISRLRDKNSIGNTRRGTGTVRLIENFSLIGNTSGEENPLMTITSGNTQIRFDGKYSLKPYTFDDDVFGHKSRKVIAFNHSNSLFECPDMNNVIKLEQYFPGTIISLKFFFDKKYLERFIN